MPDTLHPSRPDGRPVLLFYCQHSLGIGHLTRSFALVRALCEGFRVVFLNGGPIPPGVPIPAGMTKIDLPALGMDDGHNLVSRGGSHSVEDARETRRRMILAAVAEHRPRLLLVELFPFGRKKFASEILPMIRSVRRQRHPARVVCSVRDILVDARRDQQRHDDRARWLANRYFDAIVVHSDPAFARIDESFRPSKPLVTRLEYTGYVVPRRDEPDGATRGDAVLVSAGGGIVGYPLFTAALAAHAQLWPQRRVPMRIIAGPFLPEAEWQAVCHEAGDRPGVELVRHVPDMVAEMRRARLSISQCGYNTALDVVVSGVPALLVPYAAKGENEQSRRCTALAELGAVRHFEGTLADTPAFAAAIADALDFRPRPAALALDGAPRTAGLLRDLLHVDEPSWKPAHA